MNKKVNSKTGMSNLVVENEEINKNINPNAENEVTVCGIEDEEHSELTVRNDALEKLRKSVEKIEEFTRSLPARMTIADSYNVRQLVSEICYDDCPRYPDDSIKQSLIMSSLRIGADFFANRYSRTLLNMLTAWLDSEEGADIEIFSPYEGYTAIFCEGVNAETEYAYAEDEIVQANNEVRIICDAEFIINKMNEYALGGGYDFFRRPKEEVRLHYLLRDVYVIYDYITEDKRKRILNAILNVAVNLKEVYSGEYYLQEMRKLYMLAWRELPAGSPKSQTKMHAQLNGENVCVMDFVFDLNDCVCNILKYAYSDWRFYEDVKKYRSLLTE